MTTTGNQTARRETDLPLRPRVRRVGLPILTMLIGVVPGAILVGLAEFVIDGEQQLTVGAPGILLAVGGGIIGFLVGLRRALSHRTG